VFELLMRELGSDCVGRFAVEAAKAMGDPLLYSPLARLKSQWAPDRPDAVLLDDALAKRRLG
jgi:hypothetical protein